MSTPTPAAHLGLRSEYVINHLSSTFSEEEDVIVLRSPDDPNYYFGNLLALKVPLDSRTPAQWQTRFRELFRSVPEVQHCTLIWAREESTPANVREFQRLNFEYEENHILKVRREDFRVPERLNSEPEYRALQTTSDWQQWTALNIAEKLDDHREDELRPYLQGRIHNYQRLEEKGFGETLGAFQNGRLIGYAGLYHLDGLARFQNVHVIPSAQNRAIARTILTQLTQRLPDSVQELIIVADEHYHASALYQSLGFHIAERECSLCWWPGKPHRPDQNITT